MAIDGEALGFGDSDKVSRWVQQVKSSSQSGYFKTADYIPLPSFTNTDDASSALENSGESFALIRKELAHTHTRESHEG